jgi:hypothetical protein
MIKMLTTMLTTVCVLWWRLQRRTVLIDSLFEGNLAVPFMAALPDTLDQALGQFDPVEDVDPIDIHKTAGAMLVRVAEADDPRVGGRWLKDATLGSRVAHINHRQWLD